MRGVGRLLKFFRSRIPVLRRSESVPAASRRHVSSDSKVGVSQNSSVIITTLFLSAERERRFQPQRSRACPSWRAVCRYFDGGVVKREVALRKVVVDLSANVFDNVQQLIHLEEHAMSNRIQVSDVLQTR